MLPLNTSRNLQMSWELRLNYFHAAAWQIPIHVFRRDAVHHDSVLDGPV